VALMVQKDVMIFSGSAIIDYNNTSRLGGSPHPYVLIYTGAVYNEKGEIIEQH